ncbi:MAG: patatin family protein [Oscillospiraceae bacterium]|nr:patatin family protein [Oscillospiraceae bacterium]
MKIGVIDCGGGFRGIYGTGVLDFCQAHDVWFDYCVGISAGSANLSSYLARQPGRNIPFYGEYGFRKEYCGIGNLVFKHNYLNLDYVYGTLSNSDGESPLDFEAMMANPAQFVIVATDALTGETIYFDKSSLRQDYYNAIKASCALPGACQPVDVDGRLCFDGGFGDPVPVEKALADGCDKVVVILTKPRDTIREQKSDMLGVRLIRRDYPRAAEQLMLRYKKYNDGVALAKEYEKQGKVLIVAPESTCGMTTLKRTQEQLDQMYAMAQKDAAAILPFLGQD